MKKYIAIICIAVVALVIAGIALGSTKSDYSPNINTWTPSTLCQNSPLHSDTMNCSSRTGGRYYVVFTYKTVKVWRSTGVDSSVLAGTFAQQQ